MLTIDEENGCVTVRRPDGTSEQLALDTPEAFEAVSAAWLRCGWDVKYVYGFTWMGRPVIQLPEDLIRIQEVGTAFRFATVCRSCPKLSCC